MQKVSEKIVIKYANINKMLLIQCNLPKKKAPSFEFSQQMLLLPAMSFLPLHIITSILKDWANVQFP